MKKCEQVPGLSTYDHGRLVYHWYRELEEFLAYDDKTHLKKDWRIPKWLIEYSEQLAWNRFDLSTVYSYCIFHDCGKSFVRTVDDKGVHFPNHAEESYKKWIEVNRYDPNPGGIIHINQVGNLIRRDMEIHLLKAKDVPNFCRHTYEAVTLLLVGLSEVHANAEMFGGIESDSFKIKWKQINRRGMAICKYLQEKEWKYEGYE